LLLVKLNYEVGHCICIQTKKQMQLLKEILLKKRIMKMKFNYIYKIEKITKYV